MDLTSLAIIGKGTRRKKREIDLLEISEEIKSLYNTYKSLDKVAKIVKLSPEMVREFLKITELEREVKELIKLRKINSVDIGYRISKLGGNDQIILAKHVVDKNLSSGAVRAVVKYKIDNPKIPIERVINKIIQSKDKKIYVAYLGIEKDTFEKLLEKIGDLDRTKIVKSLFNGVVSSEFIIYFELNGRVVILKVSREGLQKIRGKAKELKAPIAKLADALVKKYLEGNK
jgi:hypothetical protein